MQITATTCFWISVWQFKDKSSNMYQLFVFFLFSFSKGIVPSSCSGDLFLVFFFMPAGYSKNMEAPFFIQNVIFSLWMNKYLYLC